MADPPTPPPAPIHISNFYNIFLLLFTVGIYKKSVLGRNRQNTTKCVLKGQKLPLKRPKT